jgi:hypothetical protein
MASLFDAQDSNDNELRRKALMDSLGSLGGDGGDTIAFDPSQRSDNTGINGGTIPQGAEPGGFAGPAAGGSVGAPAPMPTSGAGGGSSSPHSWIDSELQSVKSTDDPNYWYGVIAKDPKVAAGDQSAIDYWKDRIRRGDGSDLVKNGTLQKFQDVGGPTDRGLAAGLGMGGGFGVPGIPGFGGQQLDSRLTDADPFSKILEAIGKVSGPNQQALLARL